MNQPGQNLLRAYDDGHDPEPGQDDIYELQHSTSVTPAGFRRRIPSQLGALFIHSMEKKVSTRPANTNGRFRS